MSRLIELNRRYGPWIALVMGIATVLFMRQGLDLAPLAAATLLMAWLAAETMRRFAHLFASQDPHAQVTGWRRFVLPATGSLIAGLWQNVLFYLLPLWWASSILLSWNVLFPLVLTAMALLSCFEQQWQAWILEKRFVHALWTAIVAFAALVPVAALMQIPLKYSLALCAMLAVLLASAEPLLRLHSRARHRWIAAGILAAIAAGVAVWATPVLPPVPVVRMASGTGTGIQDRLLVGEAKKFAPGTSRVYAWFAVAAPLNYRQNVRFEWFHNDKLVGMTRESTIVGGRRDGFRTWTWRALPQPGLWRVDLRTDSNQLIGRITFAIE